MIEEVRPLWGYPNPNPDSREVNASIFGHIYCPHFFNQSMAWFQWKLRLNMYRSNYIDIVFLHVVFSIFAGVFHSIFRNTNSGFTRDWRSCWSSTKLANRALSACGKNTFWMMKDPSKLIVLFKLILNVLIFHFDLYEQEKSGGLWRQTIK